MLRYQPILFALLLLTSGLGYLEWGEGKSAFLFGIEKDLLTGHAGEGSFAHPLVILPLIGQVLLLLSIFPGKWSSVLGVAGALCCGILLLFLLCIGALTGNLRILASALPYTALLILLFHAVWKARRSRVG